MLHFGEHHPHIRTVDGKCVRVCLWCGSEMVMRRNRLTGGLFWGCSRYPECWGTVPILLDERLRAMGAPRLPGL